MTACYAHAEIYQLDVFQLTIFNLLGVENPGAVGISPHPCRIEPDEKIRHLKRCGEAAMFNLQKECTSNLGAVGMDGSDFDILDAALDEVLHSNDPFLLDGSASPTADHFATLASASSMEPRDPLSAEDDAHEYVDVVGNPPEKSRERSKGVKLTASQRRAQAKEKQRFVGREAQRRFRARQKNVIHELQDQIESMKLAVEEEQAQNIALSKKNGVMENLLVFKDSQVALLDDIARHNGPRKIESRIFPEVGLVLKKYTLPGAYNLEKLLRFAPAGYTDHLDDDIFAIQAPPLSAHIEQGRLIVMNMQNWLTEASRGIDTESNSLDTDSTSVSDLANMLINVHLDEAIKKGVTAISSPPQKSQPTGVDIIDPQGVRFEYCGIKYLITKDLMERIVDTMVALGQNMWSMGVFFPERMMAFSTSNMESGQPAATSEEFNDIDRWINVIRLVALREEQLQTFARAHYQYLSAVRPVLRERATIMQHLMQAASRQTDTIKDHIEATADLGDCTTALAAIVRKEYVAWADLLGTVCSGCLDYPVQRMTIWTASYPYVPNPNLVGAAAALELGLNPFEYQFNESDFETAPFLRAKE